MPVFPTALADQLAAHHGYTSTHRLRAIDITDRQRDSLVAAGLLVPFVRGVYRSRAHPDTFEGRCVGICFADDDAVITGRAGGRLWAVRRVGPARLIEVRVPHGANLLSHPEVLLRRCNVMEPVDIVERDDGIRVVSPPRLVFDLANSLSDLDLESVIEEVLDRRWCTIPTLYDTGRRLCHPARPGSARFARVLAQRPVWQKPADSHLEVQLFDALRVGGLTGMVRQHRIDLPGGWAIHADIAVPRLKWAIAVDHVTWHGGRIDAQRDKQNDRQARMIGWQVDRVTDDDIERRLPAVTTELLVIAAHLERSPRAS